MLSHTIPVNDTETTDAWERVAAEARQLLEKIEEQRHNATDLTVDSMRELLLPFIPYRSESA